MKRMKHELEYDPSGTFKMCLACGESNPSNDYCIPYRYAESAKDFTTQDIKKRADRIGRGEQKHDWFLIAFIVIFASLLAGALSGLIF